MLGYGRDESAPTPDGMFAPHFVGVRHVIANRLQHFGNLSAAVGADLSRPHIRIHPQNDKRKWRVVMWKCVFNDVKTHIR